MGGLVEAGEEKPSARRRRPYTGARLEPNLVADSRQMLQASRQGETCQEEVQGKTSSPSTAVILDARPLARFLGEAPEPRPVVGRGHIPGARSLPIGALLVEDDVTTFKSAAETREIFQKAGVARDSVVRRSKKQAD